MYVQVFLRLGLETSYVYLNVCFFFFLFNHSGWDLNWAARFLSLAFANHEYGLKRAIFLIVKHIKLIFMFEHELLYHVFGVWFFTFLSLHLRRLWLKMVKRLFPDVSSNLEILLRLWNIHALLRKFVATERLLSVKSGLWWTLSAVWVLLLLRNALLPILPYTLLRLRFQLQRKLSSWRAPTWCHAFEIRWITINLRNQIEYLLSGWRDVNLEKVDLSGRIHLLFLFFFYCLRFLVELNVAHARCRSNKLRLLVIIHFKFIYTEIR